MDYTSPRLPVFAPSTPTGPRPDARVPVGSRDDSSARGVRDAYCEFYSLWLSRRVGQTATWTAPARWDQPQANGLTTWQKTGDWLAARELPIREYIAFLFDSRRANPPTPDQLRSEAAADRFRESGKGISLLPDLALEIAAFQGLCRRAALVSRSPPLELEIAIALSTIAVSPLLRYGYLAAVDVGGRKAVKAAIRREAVKQLAGNRDGYIAGWPPLLARIAEYDREFFKEAGCRL